MEDKRKTIAVDMDEVIADVMPKFLDRYENRFGKRLSEGDLVGKKVYDIPGAADIREALFEPGFFRDLPLIEGAAEGLAFLRKHFDLYFVTAAMEFPNSLRDKYDWLFAHFEWVSWKQLIFCGDKRVIGTDYMIDDHAKNLVTFQGHGLLFDAFHNRHEQRFQRVRNWGEVVTFFEQELSQ